MELTTFASFLKNAFNNNAGSILNTEFTEKLIHFAPYMDLLSSDLLKTDTTKACGLVNLNNSCYLNCLIQFLFRIAPFRENLTRMAPSSNNLLLQLQILFAQMSFSNLGLIDPFAFLTALRDSHPHFFVQGVQNDFYETLSLILDELQSTSKDDLQLTHMILKLFRGKQQLVISHEEGNTIIANSFNTFTLNSEHRSFETAFSRCLHYQIPEFRLPNKTVSAEARLQILESPSVLLFAINRVKFQNGIASKDLGEFKFPLSLQIKKSDPFTESQREQLQKQKQTDQKIQSSLKAFKQAQQGLNSTILYMELKQMTEEQTRVHDYLEKELLLVQENVRKLEVEKQKLQSLSQIIDSSRNESYELWGLMIHQGTGSNSGHYKVCFRNQGGTWTECNDRQIEEIYQSDIDAYSARGQVCFLFYKRPVLETKLGKSIVSPFLKNLAAVSTQKLKHDINSMHVLQLLFYKAELVHRNITHYQQRIRQRKWVQVFVPICSNQYGDLHPQAHKIMLLLLMDSHSTRNQLEVRMIEHQYQTPKIINGILDSNFNQQRLIFLEFLTMNCFFSTIASSYQSLLKLNFFGLTLFHLDCFQQLLQYILVRGLKQIKMLSCCLPVDQLSLTLKKLVGKINLPERRSVFNRLHNFIQMILSKGQDQIPSSWLVERVENPSPLDSPVLQELLKVPFLGTQFEDECVDFLTNNSYEKPSQ